MPAEGSTLPARVDVPDPGRLIKARCGNFPVVRRKGHSKHQAGVAGKGHARLAGRHIPDANVGNAAIRLAARARQRLAVS
jgi:hypothetical protein